MKQVRSFDLLNSAVGTDLSMNRLGGMAEPSFQHDQSHARTDAED